MVGYHPLDGHPLFQGQGWSPIIPGIVTYQPYVVHPLYRITFQNIVAQLSKDGHLRSQAWSPTIPRTRIVTQHPQDGHLSALGWSPIIQNHIPKYCCPAFQGWSPTIQSMVTHHPKLLKSDKTQQLQLNKEFDTSAAQLVHLT